MHYRPLSYIFCNFLFLNISSFLNALFGFLLKKLSSLERCNKRGRKNFLIIYSVLYFFKKILSSSLKFNMHICELKYILYHASLKIMQKKNRSRKKIDMQAFCIKLHQCKTGVFIKYYITFLWNIGFLKVHKKAVSCIKKVSFTKIMCATVLWIQLKICETSGSTF